MASTEGIDVVEWTVDYGDDRGAEPVTLPHAWRQDVPVTFEGPAIYRTRLDLPTGASFLHFDGVSYAARIRIADQVVGEHQGLWDSFDIDVSAWSAQSVELSVEVIKNGGASYPTRSVASGFLPFVFNPFGGIHGGVSLCEGTPRPDRPAAVSRVSLQQTKILVDQLPFFMRGILTWGWYPNLGHTNPDAATIQEHIDAFRALGFNLVKFCLWVPPHRYLELLREAGMEAWLELPIWDPVIRDFEEWSAEMERIVRQYRHHDNIIAWSVGCELGSAVSADQRAYLTSMIRNLTGCPLVTDSSGGAEMYGGDPAEFGTFYDFHPYCDLPFYSEVLDQLCPGPRAVKPTILGEFNDIDVHRDLASVADAMPFWASSLPELNDKGVRWLYTLPTVVHESRFAENPRDPSHRSLIESSRSKALFMRKTVTEWVRARSEISGYVVTGERDTPISTSGFLDDWGVPRFSADECRDWNSGTVLFIIPRRDPAWIHGGNRPGTLDSLNHFAGRIQWKIGCATESSISSGLLWRIERVDNGAIVARGTGDITEVSILDAREIGRIDVSLPQGEYVLHVEFGVARNHWPIWVVPPVENGETPPPILTQATDILHAPFWRESAFEFLDDEFWTEVPFREQWSRLLPIAQDRVIRPESLPADARVLMRRIDTRTYEEATVLAQVGGVFVSTLRPEGGMGSQPQRFGINPAGVAFCRSLLRYLEKSR